MNETTTNTSQNTLTSQNIPQPSRVEELNGPKFNSSNNSQKGDRKNKSDEIAKRIEEAKSNGWGFQLKEYIQGKKYAVMALGIILTFVMGGFIAANALNGEGGLAAGFSDFKGALVAHNDEDHDSDEGETESTINIDVSEGEFTQAAESGEGVTHLARRTVESYLEDSEQSLNAEQKIYAEDYLKDSAGANALEVGQEVSFTKADVEEAVEEALALEEWQLENLRQYSQNVAW